jgi:hypothetical protein
LSKCRNLLDDVLGFAARAAATAITGSAREPSPPYASEVEM